MTLQGLPQLSTPDVVRPHVRTAVQEPSGTQLHGIPVSEQGTPQLSTPVVVWPQAGTEAEQEPFETHAQAGPTREQELPQESTPDVVSPQAGAPAEQPEQPPGQGQEAAASTAARSSVRWIRRMRSPAESVGPPVQDGTGRLNEA